MDTGNAESMALEGRTLSRRDLLRRSSVAGGSVMALGLPAGGATAQPAPLPAPVALPNLDVPPPGSVADPEEGVNLFSQGDLNFETLFTLGAAGAGTAEVGEVIATVNQINAAGASYETYYDGFVASAERVGGLAEAALRAGRRASARSAYLRSASYYDAALFFVLGTSKPDREAATYRAMQSQWDTASQLFDPVLERVAIPFEGATLPGYFMKPDNSGAARPTVIVTNGSDAQLVDTYAYGGAAAVERGYNALLYEGPGQGSMLFERSIPMRPNWETVVTPIVDYLRGRPDVDTSRIALTGWSLGGNLVLRAAAFETRLAAVVADPGFVDLWEVFPESFRNLFAPGSTEAISNMVWRQQVAPPGSHRLAFTVKKRAELYDIAFMREARAGEVPSNGALIAKKAKEYVNVDVIPKITAPTLVTNYQLDHLVPPEQADRAYGLLRSEKALVTFTVSQGAEYHCAPMAPQRRNQVVFDWLDRTLRV